MAGLWNLPVIFVCEWLDLTRNDSWLSILHDLKVAVWTRAHHILLGSWFIQDLKRLGPASSCVNTGRNKHACVYHSKCRPACLH
jgi:hypothetical protein